MSKRGHGEGTLRQLADGRWQARLTVESRQRSFYGKTQKEALAKLNAAKTAQAAGLPIAFDKLTLSAFFADWLAMKRPTVKGSVITRYEQFVRCHLVPALGTKPLAKLEPHDLTRLYAALAAPERKPRPLSAGTIKLVKVMLRGALAYAVKVGLVARNVADIAPAPRVARRERQYFDGDQARALLAAAAGDRLEALYVLAVTTGMRQGELLALTWESVDLDGALLHGRPSLYVCRSVRAVKGGFVCEEPKTVGSRRRVPLPKMTAAALRRHRAAQAEERLKAGLVWVDNDLVFASEAGSYIDRGNLQRRSFARLLKRAGQREIPFHSLRHTAITLMLQDGMDAGTIARIIGHSDGGALIHRVYGHVTPAMLDRAVTAMEARFGS